MVSNDTKAPRLFGNYDFNIDTPVPLSDDHNHYLLSVMRRQDGDTVRLFNGYDGEYIGTIEKISKKAAVITNIKQTRKQPQATNKKTLYFPLIKKDRLAFMIEKAVELGVTDLIPFTSDHTDSPRFKADKTEKHIIEAAEQCERLTIPTLHAVQTLHDILSSGTQIHCAIERDPDLTAFPSTQTRINNYACIVGPEGGWSEDELALLKTTPTIIPVSLGDNILRAETAAIYMLARPW